MHHRGRRTAAVDLNKVAVFTAALLIQRKEFVRCGCEGIKWSDYEYQIRWLLSVTRPNYKAIGTHCKMGVCEYADDTRRVPIPSIEDLDLPIIVLRGGTLIDGSSDAPVADSVLIFTLRGIGMNDVQSNQNPAITPYVDEIPLASHVMVGFHIFDLERVEVLKGPQGTLYGRNTTGGAIRFISREFEASGRADFAEYYRIEYEVGIGGPISETLTGRLAVGGVHQQEEDPITEKSGLRVVKRLSLS